jgi:hypothetical protein
MGLWVQNVGVRAPSVPAGIAGRASAQPDSTPESMEGWAWATWATLADGNFLDLEELDALAAEAAGEAEAPALAYSVHDSDSVYLTGADHSGARFRLMLNPEAWEDELPPQEVDAAAGWARDHAPLDPSPEEITDVVGRQFVFAEDGLNVLFAHMGLLPAELGEGAQEMPG